MDLNKKQHWFQLAFSVPVPGAWQPVSLTVGVPAKLMTSVAMEQARDQNGLPQSAVVTGVSYLGYATAHKMRGTSERARLTEPSEAFRQGMRAAVLPAGVEAVTNPYRDAEGIQDQDILVQEWDAGYNEAKGAISAVQHL